jgi:hypothetical protein
MTANGIAKTINQYNKLTIKQMQKLVGGYVEVYYMPKDKTNLVCNSDGKMIGLTYNTEATDIMHYNIPHTKGIDYMVGDVLVLHGKSRIKHR